MSARVSLRIRYERRSHLVLLLTLALLTAAFLGYLLWAQEEAAASGTQAPLTASAVMRHYYLTEWPHDGSQADEAGVCEPGYHFASLYEILDTSNLRYNADLGWTAADSGQGPPTGLVGWVRTGYDSSGSDTPGQGNCDNWDSNAEGVYGAKASLPHYWPLPPDMFVWEVSTGTCNNFGWVWCVEDYLVPKMIYLPLVMKNY